MAKQLQIIPEFLGQLRGPQEGEAGPGGDESVGDCEGARPAVAAPNSAGGGWPHRGAVRLRRGVARPRRGSKASSGGGEASRRRGRGGWGGRLPSRAVSEAGSRGPSSGAERGLGWLLRAVVGLLRRLPRVGNTRLRQQAAAPN